MADLGLPVPDNSRQIAFHELLVIARQDWLIDAVKEALGKADPVRLRDELTAFVPADVHQLLAIAGLPDEYVFPLPAVLEAKPTLVGYYRLLLGLPRKSFYGSGTGMGKFRGMEEGGSTGQVELLPEFCRAMGAALADMVRQLSPAITQRDLIELPVMTLGQQFQGANNNTIGIEATKGVFRVIKDIVQDYATAESETEITIRNPAGRTLTVVLVSDPDVGIREIGASGTTNLVALEIKGGADRSNQHNRIGEAEKSHLKARDDGYRDFWTVIRTKTLDAVARRQSPTTRSWFDAAQVLDRGGPDWELFCREIARVVGIPDQSTTPIARPPTPREPSLGPDVP